jgi:hypothetical protein
LPVSASRRERSAKFAVLAGERQTAVQLLGAEAAAATAKIAVSHIPEEIAFMAEAEVLAGMEQGPLKESLEPLFMEAQEGLVQQQLIQQEQGFSRQVGVVAQNRVLAVLGGTANAS